MGPERGGTRTREPLRGHPIEIRLDLTLKRRPGDAMGVFVSPNQRAFLTLVLRYQSLIHDGPGDERNAELSKLERILAPRGTARVERRYWRRICTRMRGTIRSGGLASPCIILDFGAGGLRISNEGGLPLQVWRQVVVSLHPGDVGLRIDLPATVCYADPDRDDVGLRFCGPPVMCHHRGTVRTASGSTDGRTAEVPIARSTKGRDDLAA